MGQRASPDTKSRTLRPARSMVKAAISTDRSLTAPTMAASSLGGCGEETPEAERTGLLLLSLLLIPPDCLRPCRVLRPKATVTATLEC